MWHVVPNGFLPFRICKGEEGCTLVYHTKIDFCITNPWCISIASRSESSDCFILYIYLYLNKKLKKACFKCTSANAPCFRGENC